MDDKRTVHHNRGDNSKLSKLCLMSPENTRRTKFSWKPQVRDYVASCQGYITIKTKQAALLDITGFFITMSANAEKECRFIQYDQLLCFNLTWHLCNNSVVEKNKNGMTFNPTTPLKLIYLRNIWNCWTGYTI